MSDSDDIRHGLYRDALRRTRDSANHELLQNRLRALNNTKQQEKQNLGQLSYKSNTRDSSTYSRIKREIHNGLIETLNPQAVAKASMEQVRDAINEYVGNSISVNDYALNAQEQKKLNEDLLYEVLGLGPLTPLMTDPTISDILVNSPDEIYVERKGKLERTEIKFHDDEHLLLTIERILSTSQRRVDESNPMADARLPDGSRVNVIIPPIAVKGPTISIRRFAVKRFSLTSLAASNAMTENAAEFLAQCARAKLNILISGGTGSGKTTLLNAVAEHIPESERIITIEDTAELKLPHEHLVTLEGRPPNVEGIGEISIRALVKNALRMRPDRVIIGESRGPEALDMLQAMNTGHEGSMTTVHANSPRDALSRLETMMLMADVDLPQRVLREQVGSALNLIVQLSRLPDGSRRIMYITEVSEVDNGVILTQDLFVTRREDHGMVMRGKGVLPTFAEMMYNNGVKLDEKLLR